MSGRSVLVCAPMLPAFDRESGSRRIYDAVQFFREEGWSVTYVARSAADGEHYVRLLQQQGVAAYVGLEGRTLELIEHQRFDLALIAFWYLAEAIAPRIRAASPGTRVVVDSIDLHFLRNSRRIFGATRAGRPPASLDGDYAGETIRELNAYAAADGVLTVSDKEAGLINDWVGDGDLAHAVPDCESLPSSPLPVRQRRGILFIGNFRHPPNVQAVEHLCREIVPRLDPELLEAHPISIVGNGLSDEVRSLAEGSPHVRMIGWVPSVIPYLSRARVSVIPLLYGAGTKRKLIQALMVGTPTVTTRIGAEGLGVQDGEHALVADTPSAFADGVARLLTDQALWDRLMNRGRAHIAASHGREVVRGRFSEVIGRVMAKPPKPPPGDGADPAPPTPGRETGEAYARDLQRVRETVRERIPEGATVLVVSRGDEELLKLEGRRGWHFPQTEDGTYAGHHPGDSEEAIAHLEALRGRGADYLLFPRTSFWWLDHYRDFGRYLEQRCRPVWSDESCLTYRICPSPGSPVSS